MATTENKIKRLEQLTGKTDQQLAEHACYGSEAYGICKNDGCCYYDQYEPDQDKGWCPECKENTVVSILVMMGLI